MRIRSLEVTGFKSFGDRAVLAFGGGISAIVGPNGCGKSNIVDAIRWVMGEQNPRHLRGRLMEDMIFAGTESKPSVGMAEVVLTLDNESGLAPGIYKDFGEIQIARRLYRSGESEYLINKTPCRLRDITDFFLDTGVGTRGYTIVEQGQVDDVVSTKPEERRVIFEEAAGIGKYRQRRRESERKLLATEQNLLRVTDIIGELNRQISSLDRQARKANRYKTLSARQRDLELVVAHEGYRRDAGRLEEAERSLEGLRIEAAALDARVARAQADVETSRRAHLERERELQSKSEAIYSLRSAIQTLESRIEYERRERESLLRLTREREGEISQLDEQHSGHTRSLSEVIAEHANVVERQERDEAELSRREARLREHIERSFELRGRLEAAQGHIVDLSTEAATLESRAQGLEERGRELEQRVRETDEALETHSLAAERLARDEIGLETRLRSSLSERDALGRLLAEQLRASEEAVERLSALHSDLGEARVRAEHDAAQLESLREIEKREAQRVAGALERAPDEQRRALEGRLSEVIRARDGVEPALEAVLGARLEAVLVASPDRALDLLGWLRTESAGRATVLSRADGDADDAPGFVPLGRPLLDFVSAREPWGALLRRLLRDVYLVEDLGQAVSRFGVTRPPAIFVTRGGELLDRHGALTGGLGAAPGALSRVAEIRRLSGELEVLAARRAELEAEVARAAEAVEQAGRDLENTRNRRHTAELAVVNVEKDLERMRERGKEALESLEERRTGKAALVAQVDVVAEQREALDGRRMEIDRERGGADAERQALRSQTDELAREQERLEARLVQARVELAELGARRDQLVESRTRLQGSVDEGRRWIERHREEVREARERAESLATSVIEAESELSDRIAEEEAQRAGQESLREGYESTSERVEAGESAARKAAREREGLREQQAQGELSLQEVRMKCDQVRERIRERYEVEIGTYRPPPEHLLGEPEARAAELEKLRADLRALGEVHLGAIEEYEEVSERSRYLSEQKADLEISIERLRSAIARINRTSRARFRETFEAVNEEFKRIFPRMFQGGRAHLSLTETEDVLEAGIEISAQPPGKKLQNVNLLSGGEKALTALSLLMAVFTVKPSPFFLLDEVDAALDDANAARWNVLLTERAEASQFLLITHNKGTIETAHTLYGVTMQEPGLSKLVTVDLKS